MRQVRQPYAYRVILFYLAVLFLWVWAFRMTYWYLMARFSYSPTPSKGDRKDG